MGLFKRLLTGSTVFAVAAVGAIGAYSIATGHNAADVASHAVALVTQHDSAYALTINPVNSGSILSGSTVQIDASDVTNVNQSTSNLLVSIFEVLKLLPFIALIAGGFYLLEKLFGILPRFGGRGE